MSILLIPFIRKVNTFYIVCRLSRYINKTHVPNINKIWKQNMKASRPLMRQVTKLTETIKTAHAHCLCRNSKLNLERSPGDKNFNSRLSRAFIHVKNFTDNNFYIYIIRVELRKWQTRAQLFLYRLYHLYNINLRFFREEFIIYWIDLHTISCEK